MCVVRTFQELAREVMKIFYGVFRGARVLEITSSLNVEIVPYSARTTVDSLRIQRMSTSLTVYTVEF